MQIIIQTKTESYLVCLHPLELYAIFLFTKSGQCNHLGTDFNASFINLSLRNAPEIWFSCVTTVLNKFLKNWILFSAFEKSSGQLDRRIFPYFYAAALLLQRVCFLRSIFYILHSPDQGPPPSFQNRSGSFPWADCRSRNDAPFWC